MRTIAELKARADQLLFSDEHEAALYAYATLVRLQPENLDARLRVGDSLLAMGEVQSAAVVYTALARHAARAGYPLRALVALKILSALEPQLDALLGTLAERYAAGSPAVGRSVRLSGGDADAPLPSGFDPGIPPPRPALVQAATQAGADYQAIAAYPEQVPPIPLFSELPADAFERVLGALKLVRTRASAPIIREGEPGQSFYVLARGAVEVSRQGPDDRRVRLASLHDGAIFGEMALVSAQPRSASVISVTDCDLLEFDREALEAAAREVGTVAAALDAFTRERLLSNLLATAPLFKPLSRKQRIDLMRRFSAVDVKGGTPVVREGDPGEGLYVVLTGEVDVSKQDGDEKVLLATLRPGDVFGEIALLNDEPTSATVTAATAATVLFLARQYFQRLTEAVPEIREYIESLGEERLMDTRILLSATIEETAEPLSDDDLILV